MRYACRGKEEGLLAESTPERRFALHQRGNRLIRAVEVVRNRTRPRPLDSGRGIVEVAVKSKRDLHVRKVRRLQAPSISHEVRPDSMDILLISSVPCQFEQLAD
jgi:hypothetical protein